MSEIATSSTSEARAVQGPSPIQPGGVFSLAGLDNLYTRLERDASGRVVQVIGRRREGRIVPGPRTAAPRSV